MPDNPAQLAIQLNANHYYAVASFALLYYEYLLTIEQEIRFFWGRRITLASSLFLVCRYLTLLGNIPVIFQTFVYWTPNSCRLLQRYHQGFSFIIQTIVGFILIARTYALYQRSRRILALTCFTAFSVIALAAWAVTKGPTTSFDRPMLPNVHGCNPRVEPDAGRRLGATWAGVVVFDTEILILTVWKTYKLSRTGGGHIVHVLLRDGFTYYGILTMSNVTLILTFLLTPPSIKGVGTIFVTIISVIVITRLMLNLRNPHSFESTGHLDTLPWFGTFQAKEKTQISTVKTASARNIPAQGVPSLVGTHKDGTDSECLPVREV